MNNLYFSNSEFGQYVVKKGDTLFLIAKKYNTTPEQLMMINNLSSTMIYPNQVLYVPYVENEGFISDEYITKNGDSLNLIAKKHQMKPDNLLMYNDVKKLELVPNQVVKLGEKKSMYVIEDGDTVDMILEKTGLSCLDLITLNPNLFKPGISLRTK